MKKFLFILSLFILPFFILSQEQEWVKLMQDPEANFYTIQQSFSEFWKTHDANQKGNGYKVFKRWENFVAPRVFPSGKLSELNKTAQNFQSYLNSQSNPVPQNHVIGGNNNIASTTWTAMSGAITNSLGGGQTLQTGRVNFITIDPNNLNNLWVGAPAGGLWSSTNGGTTWSTNTDNLGVIGCSDLAIDPSNSSVMYLATGDGEAGDTPSMGVLKTTNGGSTWAATSFTWAVSGGLMIRRLIVNPSNSQIVILASNAGIYRTTNGGTTWTQVASGSTHDLEFKPGDPNTVYAGGSVFRISTNAGASFTTITNGIPSTGINRMAIATTAADANYVYVLASSSSNSGLQGFYKSVASGTVFSQMTTTLNLLGWSNVGSDSGGQGWYDLCVACSPTNRDEVVTGGVNVWRTTNGGSSWSIFGHWYGSGAPFTHADHHELEYASNGTLYNTNDGTVNRYNVNTWTEIFGSVNVGQIYKIGLSSISPNKWIIGRQDNGTSVWNGTTNNSVIGGDGMDCFFDRTTDQNIFGETQNGGLRRSTNGGASWSSVTSGLSSPSGFPWVTIWKQDPTVGQRLYCGLQELFVSNNLATSWAAVTATIPASGNIIEFAIAPSNNQVIYVLKSSGVFKTINAGTSWINITSTLPVGSGAPQFVTIDPLDPTNAWVVFSGYSSGNKVFETSNGGTSWTNVSTNLPNIPANCIVYVPNSSDKVFVGMDVGVYYKDALTANWTLYNSGLPNVPISDLEISPAAASKIRAASFGRGVYEVDIPCASNPTVSVSNQTICSGSSATLIASGATTYTWNTGATTSVIVVSPSVTSIYTITGSAAAGCTDTKTVSVLVNSTPTISVSNQTVCAGGSATLLASGALTYSWSTGALTSSIVVTPTANTNYTVYGDNNGCTSSNTVSVTIGALNVLLTASSGTICNGNSSILSASGASSYTWSTGSNSNSIIVSPINTTTYSLIGSNGSCFGTSSVTIVVSNSLNLNVVYTSNPLNPKVCVGGTIQAFVSGGTAPNYTWFPGGVVGNLVVLSPTASVNYTVVGSSGSCTSTLVATPMVTVDTGPSFIISANPAVVCPGTSATLSASALVPITYSWSTGSTSSVIVVSPTTTSLYTLIGTNLLGCPATSIINVFVYAPTTVTISSSAATVCVGSSMVFTGTGASSYTWLPGNINTAATAFSPTSNITYTLIGVGANGCLGQTTKAISIVAQTSITAQVSPTAVCAGSSVTLSGNNICSGTYSITSGAFSPIATGSSSIVTLPDDALTGALNIGFPFNFYCNTYSQFYISSNGFITFSVNSGNGCCAGQLIPNAAAPNNLISAAWTDLDPSVGGSITYATIGSSPTRSLLVKYINVPIYGSSVTVTTEIRLFETTNIIEIHTSTITALTVRTMGIENALGTSAYAVAGRNSNAAWSAFNEMQRFTPLPSIPATYTWMPGPINNSSVTLTPTVSTIYTLSGSSSGCVGSATVALQVNPVPSISVSPISLCQGNSGALLASGALSYTWNTGATTASISVSPSVTTNYTVTGSNGLCLSNTTVSVNVTPTPTISASDQTICIGSAATILASGALTYSWNTGSTLSSIVVTPTVNTSYTVTGTTGACSGLKVVNVTVLPLPSLTLTSSSASVCVGSSATIIATGATSYTWNTGATTNSIIVSPTVTTTYTVSGNNGFCTGSNVKTIFIAPNFNISVQSSTISLVGPWTASTLNLCQGNTGYLNATGALSYTWNTGATNGAIMVTPSVTTNYTVTGSNGSCLSNTTVLVNVTPTPSVSAADQTICIGSAATILASGALTYSWNTGSTLSSIVVTPTVNTSYTVTGTTGACSGLKVVNVTVLPLPSLTLTSSSASVCVGSSATIIATGATSYTWNTGATTNSIVVSPSVITTYTATGSNGLCIGTNIKTILIAPNFNISVNTLTLCQGNTGQLNAIGANSYTWNTGSNSSSIVVSPSVSTNYTVTGSNGSCLSNTTVLVNVIPTPSLTANNQTVCPGGSATLTANGAISYIWNTGALTNIIVVSPTVNTIYTFTGTSNGCSNTKTVSVNLGPSLGINLSISNVSICLGSTTSIIASGASSYTWNTGSNSNSIVVSPVSTTTYSVVGVNGVCTGNTITTIYVSASPTLASNNPSVCLGSVAVLTVTGANSYTLNPGNLTGSSFSISPLATSVYTVVGNNGICSVIINPTVYVNSIPTVAVNNQTICNGGTTTLIASGANSYSWNTGSISNSIVVSPISSTNYTVVGTSLGCTNTGTVSVTVNALLILNPIASPSIICSSSSSTLTANGASSYTWSTGSNSSSIVVSPSVTTSYTLIGSSGTCNSNTIITIVVSPTPSVTLTSSPNSSICAGASATLSANGASSYSWSSGAGTSSIIVSPSITTVYTVTGTSLGCSDTQTTSVAVGPSTIILVLNASSPSLCAGGNSSITVNGASTYTWSTGSNSQSFAVTPSLTTTYSVTGSNAGCNAFSAITITVIPIPTLTLVSSPGNTICTGATATISVIGANNYTWSTGSNSNSVLVTPSVNTVYSVTGSNSGCISTETITISTGAISLPITIVSSPSTICIGLSTTITASGASTYSWSNGSNASFIVVNPTVSSTYSVVGANGFCSGTNSANITVSALPILTITALPAGPICAGANATLNVIGATTYSWNNGSSLNPLVVSPTVTTVYTVTGDNNGCTNTQTIAVTVGAGSIAVAITPNSSSLCLGGSTTIFASGASSYTWSNGSNLNSIIVSPTVTTTYSIVGTNGVCSGNAFTTISILVAPALNINASPSNTLCIGQTASLSASGNYSNFVWTSPLVSNFSIAVTPSSNIVYTVSASGNTLGCSTKSFVSIYILQNPISSLTTTNNGCLSNCSGVLSASTTGGSPPYTYSLTNSSCTTIPCSNLCNGLYNLSTKDAFGCSSFNIFSIANAVNILSSSISFTNVSCATCTNGALKVSASGGNSPYTYTWSPTGGNSVIASGLAVGCYTVKVKDAKGCFVNSNYCISSPNGIEATGLTLNDVFIYPNPAKTFVNIEFNGAPFDYTVFNNLGQIILFGKQVINKATINLNQFAKGIYFVEVESGNNKIHKKVVLE